MKDEVQGHHFVHLKASGYELDNLKKKIDLPSAPLEFKGLLNTRAVTAFRWTEEQFAQVVGSCILRLGKRDDLQVEKTTFCYCLHEPVAQRMDYASYIQKIREKEQPAAAYSAACAVQSPLSAPVAEGLK